MSCKPPTDPRLLELLPGITRAAMARAHARRFPLEQSEVRSIVAVTLLSYLKRHPEGTADEHYGAAYFRVRGALLDHIRHNAIRRRKPGPTGNKWGYDDAEVMAAIATGQLRSSVPNGFESDGSPHFELIDPHAHVDELIDQARERLRRQRLLLEAPGCTVREKQAIRYHLLEGHNQAATAQIIGVSVPRVSQLLNHAIAKLRRHQGIDPPRQANRRGRPKKATPGLLR